MTAPAIVILDARAARELTERIRDAVEDLWRLLEAAHAGGAWRVLGYDSWSAYVQTEFAMSKQHSYRLLDQALVIRELEAVTESHACDSISVRQAQAIKPRLAEVKELVKAEPERAADIVASFAKAPRAAPVPDDDVYVYVCLTCAEVFDRPVWECPGCAHHWAEGDSECRNCHNYERNPNGDIVAVSDDEDDEDDDEEEDTGPPISKPDLGGGVSHPARYSLELIPVFAGLLAGCRTVLDPFAGTGRIHLLRPEFDTTGVELEPEWANQHDDTIVASALSLPFDDASFDAICTSPTYGNRYADHHNAADPHLRRSYTHDLGRALHAENSGVLHWGEEYREFHRRAWKEAARVMRPGGAFVLNIKDHTRNGTRQPVSAWHVNELVSQGFSFVDCVAVPTSQLRQGTNSEARWGELVWLLRAP